MRRQAKQPILALVVLFALGCTSRPATMADVGAFQFVRPPNGNDHPEFNVWQNYPNPFNRSTTIHFSLPSPANVTMKIYDMLGRDVQTVLRAALEAGQHDIQLDAVHLASGVYFCHLEAGPFSRFMKMVVVR